MFLISSMPFPSSVMTHSHLTPLSSSTYIVPQTIKQEIPKSEADELKTANNDILHGTNGMSSSTSLDYWLGSAYDIDDVYKVSYYGGMYYEILTSYNTTGLKVRPVIEIATSKITAEN